MHIILEKCSTFLFMRLASLYFFFLSFLCNIMHISIHCLSSATIPSKITEYNSLSVYTIYSLSIHLLLGTSIIPYLCVLIIFGHFYLYFSLPLTWIYKPFYRFHLILTALNRPTGNLDMSPYQHPLHCLSQDKIFSLALT